MEKPTPTRNLGALATRRGELILGLALGLVLTGSFVALVAWRFFS